MNAIPEFAILRSAFLGDSEDAFPALVGSSLKFLCNEQTYALSSARSGHASPAPSSAIAILLWVGLWHGGRTSLARGHCVGVDVSWNGCFFWKV